MPTIVRNMLIAVLAFAIPLSVTAFSNRESLRPYFRGDADTAEGQLLYFTRRG